MDRTIEELKNIAEAKPIAWVVSAIDGDETSFVTQMPEVARMAENVGCSLTQLYHVDVVDASRSSIPALIERAERAEAALKLAEGRLALLLRVFPEEREDCDHPTATRSVLASVTEALWRSS